ncbi:MAG: KEOPS complex kinase/ATPase Bud32 [archaeon]
MPSKSEKIISIGAEAVLTQKELLGKSIVEKTRVLKHYRHADLDERLRRERTKSEARMLHHVKTIGVLAPILYDVNTHSAMLRMEYIDAPRLKHFLLDKKNKMIEKEKMCGEFGKMIAALHSHGVVHGDLTTSNVLVRKKIKEKTNELVMIDFGLSFQSNKLEDLAVDLVNLKKTFTATHSTFEKGWEIIQESYVKNGGKKQVLKQMEEVEARIRYA